LTPIAWWTERVPEKIITAFMSYIQNIRKVRSSYIERFADGIGKNYSVRVITSDAMVQLSALGSGVLRISTREFRLEVDWILKKLGKDIEQINNSVRKEKVGDKIKNVNK